MNIAPSPAQFSKPPKIRTPLDGALYMAQRGFKVFPLKPESKEPYELAVCDVKHRSLAGGIHQAACDEKRIRRWCEIEAGINFGVSASDLVILDIDTKHGKRGFEDLAGLGPLPSTLTVKTWSGGEHRYFAGPPTGQAPLSNGIDVRSRNGYVLAPGSRFNGKPYIVICDAPPAELPQEIRAKISEARRQHKCDVPLADLDQEAAIQWAREYLAHDAPVAVEGSRGITAYAVAARLGDAGISEETALELMHRWNEEKNDPPQTDENLQVAVGNSYRYRQRALGITSPMHEFEDIFEDFRREREAERKRKLSELLEFASDVKIKDLAAWQASALVKNVLGRGESATLYAETTAGKTFAGIDLAWHLALGRDWHGHKVKKAPVLYVALEGVKGFRKRVLAAQMRHGDPGRWFARLKPHVSLVKGKAGEAGLAQVIAAAKAIEAETGQPVGLVVIDTFARAVAGDDENAAADMMAYLEQRVGEIIRETGAAVLTVHHPNKGGSFRGSTAGPGGFDVILRIDQTGEWRTLVAEKVKDDASQPLFDFVLDEVDLGETDDDGDPMTSCLLLTRPPREQAKRNPRQRRRPMGKRERTFRAAFDKLEADDKAISAEHPETGELGRRIAVADLREEFMRAYPTGEADDDKKSRAKQKAWRDATADLPSGFVHFPDDRGDEWIWRSDDVFSGA